MKSDLKTFSIKTIIKSRKRGHVLYPAVLGVMFTIILIMAVLIVSTLEEYYLKKTINDKMEEILESRFIYNSESDKIVFKKLNKETNEYEELEFANTDSIENEENTEIKEAIEEELKESIRNAAQSLMENGLAFSMMKKLSNETLYEKYGNVTEVEKSYDKKGIESKKTRTYVDSEIGVEIDFEIKTITYTVSENGNREIVTGDLTTGNMKMYSGIKFLSKIKIKYAFPVFFEFIEQDEMEKQDGETIKRIHFVQEYIKSI
jgi:hypothetical protein